MMAGGRTVTIEKTGRRGTPFRSLLLQVTDAEATQSLKIPAGARRAPGV
jgi:hypothetical protein